MKLSAICFSDRGLALARRLPADRIYGGRQVQAEDVEPFERVGKLAGRLFAEKAEALVFIGACGIAVRAIAPWLRDKTVDPAVLVIDEKGDFVISLLSGHLGGANRLAADLAQRLGAAPVITTASDVWNHMAIDLWAQEHQLVITDMKLAKEMEARLLSGEPLGISSEKPVTGWQPEFSRDQTAMGLWIGERPAQPYETTLWLRPRHLTLGVGCRKGKSPEAIEEAALRILTESGYDPRQVKAVASIDIKQSEPGIQALAQTLRAQLRFYSTPQLREARGSFTPSSFVRSVTGVDNVCERSAVMGGGRLTVPKTIANGITIAVAEEEWNV